MRNNFIAPLFINIFLRHCYRVPMSIIPEKKQEKWLVCYLLLKKAENLIFKLKSKGQIICLKNSECLYKIEVQETYTYLKDRAFSYRKGYVYDMRVFYSQQVMMVGVCVGVGVYMHSCYFFTLFNALL